MQLGFVGFMSQCSRHVFHRNPEQQHLPVSMAWRQTPSAQMSLPNQTSLACCSPCHAKNQCPKHHGQPITSITLEHTKSCRKRSQNPSKIPVWLSARSAKCAATSPEQKWMRSFFRQLPLISHWFLHGIEATRLSSWTSGAWAELSAGAEHRISQNITELYLDVPSDYLT